MSPGDLVVPFSTDGAIMWRTSDGDDFSIVGRFRKGRCGLVVAVCETMALVVAEGTVGHCFIDHLEGTRTC